MGVSTQISLPGGCAGWSSLGFEVTPRRGEAHGEGHVLFSQRAGCRPMGLRWERSQRASTQRASTQRVFHPALLCCPNRGAGGSWEPGEHRPAVPEVPSARGRGPGWVPGGPRHQPGCSGEAVALLSCPRSSLLPHLSAAQSAARSSSQAGHPAPASPGPPAPPACSPLTPGCKVSRAGGWKSDSWCCSSAG